MLYGVILGGEKMVGIKDFLEVGDVLKHDKVNKNMRFMFVPKVRTDKDFRCLTVIVNSSKSLVVCER